MMTRSKDTSNSSNETASSSEDQLNNLRSEWEAQKIANDQQLAAMKASHDALAVAIDAKMDKGMSSLQNLIEALMQKKDEPQPAQAKEQKHQAESSRANLPRSRDRGKEPIGLPGVANRRNHPAFEVSDNEEECEKVPPSFSFTPPIGVARGYDYPEDDHTTRGQPRGDPRVRRLEMPLFGGSNVDEWIFRAERYFQVNGLTDNEAFIAATMCLENKAFKWYSWACQLQPINTWRQLKRALIERFQGTDAVDTYEKFLSLTQTRSVMDYRERFEEFAGVLEGISSQALMATFMKGLKPEIRAAVKIQQPRDLQQTMHLAQLVEEKDQHKPNRGTMPPSRPINQGGNRWAGAPRQHFQKDNNFQRTAAPQQQQRPQYPEPRERKDNNCYRCKEPWKPGHRCTTREFRALKGPDEEGAGVSLNSVAGLTPARAMKLKGIIGKSKVTILIDSGATHNFISPMII